MPLSSRLTPPMTSCSNHTSTCLALSSALLLIAAPSFALDLEQAQGGLQSGSQIVLNEIRLETSDLVATYDSADSYETGDNTTVYQRLTHLWFDIGTDSVEIGQQTDTDDNADFTNVTSPRLPSPAPVVHMLLSPDSGNPACLKIRQFTMDSGEYDGAFDTPNLGATNATIADPDELYSATPGSFQVEVLTPHIFTYDDGTNWISVRRTRFMVERNNPQRTSGTLERLRHVTEERHRALNQGFSQATDTSRTDQSGIALEVFSHFSQKADGNNLRTDLIWHPSPSLPGTGFIFEIIAEGPAVTAYGEASAVDTFLRSIKPRH